jgi:hypothetical protein
MACTNSIRVVVNGRDSRVPGNGAPEHSKFMPVLLARWTGIAFAMIATASRYEARAGEPAGRAWLTPRPLKLRLRSTTVHVKPVSIEEPKSAASEVPPVPANQSESVAVSTAERQWTLDVFEALALQHNPMLAQAAAVDADRCIYDQVGRYPNPQVGYLRSDSSGLG